MSNTANTQHAHCLRCGRTITAAASIKAQYGPGCRARIRAAALTEAVKGFTAAQADKARQLIDDGGIVAIRQGIFRASASNGTDFYLVAVTGQCNCPAGLRSRACYHFAAARIMNAGKAA